MPQYNGVQPQHSAVNLDLAITAQSNHFNPYLEPPSGIREFPVPVHRAYDQLSLSSSQKVIGVRADSYFRNIPYVDGVKASFKRNIVEGVPTNHQYHHALAVPSSSVAAPSTQPAESDVTSTDAAYFLPLEYGGSDPASMVENGSHRIVRNRLGLIRPESALAHNTGHLLRNYVASSVQIHCNPWLDMQFGVNNSDIGTFPWTQAPNPPYAHGFQLYQSHQRDITLDTNARHRNLPHMRVLPEDEVAVLEIPGYHEHEVGGSIDQHIDMHLDINHMSYETHYKNGETIASLDCGHEYHSGCIEKWLPMKNTCPVCKSTALSYKPKDS